MLQWLYSGERKRIPRAVQRRLDREQLALSPFAQLELAYLHEIGRARNPAQQVVDELSLRMELTVADVSAATVCKAAIDLTWTRDPFDRLLAAHATVANLTLVTKDEAMRRYLPLAWWAEDGL